MYSSHELPPPYEDDSAKIAKELEDARKMIEMLTTDRKRDEEKERKRELKEYAMSLEKRTIQHPNERTHNIDIFSHNYIFWEYLDTLDETFIFLSRDGNLLLTNKNLYITNFPLINASQQYQIQNKNDIMLCPLYTFDEPLLVTDLTMFNNKGFVDRFYNIVLSGGDTMLGLYEEATNSSPSDDTSKYKYNMQRRLHYIELMITTIPGSYKNKGWKNIGGFTGVYINDMKGLFQPHPPRKEL
jgi:hypothetical protein